MDTAKEVKALKILDKEKFYMNPATGSVDTGEGWIQDCTDQDNGFPVTELGTLCEVREPRTAFERHAWGKWVPVD